MYRQTANASIAYRVQDGTTTPLSLAAWRSWYAGKHQQNIPHKTVLLFISYGSRSHQGRKWKTIINACFTPSLTTEYCTSVMAVLVSVTAFDRHTALFADSFCSSSDGNACSVRKSSQKQGRSTSSVRACTSDYTDRLICDDLLILHGFPLGESTKKDIFTAIRLDRYRATCTKQYSTALRSQSFVLPESIERGS